MGRGKADLLEKIGVTGSISEAAGELEMSYMRAWSLIKTMNRCFKSPVLIAERGGKRGGGAQLTATGKKALKLYRQIECKSLDATRPLWKEFQGLLRS